MRYSYDEKCEELARHFLPSTIRDSLIKELAQHIQDGVEGWLQDKLTDSAQSGEGSND